MIEIDNATSELQLDQVRHLLRAFVDWHRRRHIEDRQLIDAYFEDKVFEEELARLPDKYAPPRGRLLLAYFNGQAAGCAALREIDGRTCEMKRMFVYPEFHGKGIGRALAERLIQESGILGIVPCCWTPASGRPKPKTFTNNWGFNPSNPTTISRTTSKTGWSSWP